MSLPIRGQGGHLIFPIGPKTTKFVEDIDILLLVKFRGILLAVSKKSKMCQPIRGQGGHLVFPIGQKNSNLVEDIEILLLVKFRGILFSSFKGEVENVSANQRPGRQSCFSDRPKNTNLVEDVEILLPVKFQVSVQRFQKRSRKCLSQSEARAAILFVQSA